MKFVTVLGILLIFAAAGFKYTYSAPSEGQGQAHVGRVAQPFQQIQSGADGFPTLANLTQQVLAELRQFGGSGMVFSNPCQFFQGLFRQIYCTVASFDPQRKNPIVQGILQIIIANQAIFNFFSNFFCTLAGFGGTGGGAPGGDGAVNCAQWGVAYGNSRGGRGSGQVSSVTESEDSSNDFYSP